MNRRILPALLAALCCLGVSLLLLLSPNRSSDTASVKSESENPVSAPDSAELAAMLDSSLAKISSPNKEESTAPQTIESPENNAEAESDARAITLAMSDEDRERLRLRKQFAEIASTPIQIPRSAFAQLLSANPGDEVELPTTPPLAGTVSHNFLHKTGGRGFGIRLRDFPGAQFSVAVEPDGSISGHIVQQDNPDSFLVSSGSSQQEIILEKTRTDHIICSWKDSNGNSKFGHLVAEPEEGEEIPEPAGEFMVPDLESRPGAPQVIYLDFDGEVVENTSWAGGARIDAAAYAFPARIPGIFKAMAEDFAPFNVNVTTVRASFDNANTANRCQVIFTPTKTAAPTAGGVAYLNSFGSSVNFMCWAFNAGEQSAGETGSHEVGHQLGLRHDGRSTTPDPETYFRGHTHTPTGIKWGPIMGAAFGQDITHWSKGEYLLANNQEDDFLKIIDDLPYLPDDHGGGTGGATNISTDISLTYDLTGRIGQSGDRDVFRLELKNKGGTVTANVDPTEDTYANLDLVLELLDSTGAVLNTVAPANNNNASLTVPNLAIGVYYIRVSGGGLGATGFAENGYNNYCSLGNYTLNGTYPFLLIPDPPDGLTATDGTSTDNVFINWNSTEDTDGYRVYRSQINDPETAPVIADVTATSFTDTTALHNVVYYYWVKSYNVQGDSADFSNGDDGFRRLPLPDTPGSLSATDGSSTAYTRVSWAIANFAYEYEVYRNDVNSTTGGTLMTTTSSSSYDDTTGTQGVVYYYYVRSINPEGSSSYSSVNSGFRRIPPPSAPTGVAASDGTSATETVITWNSVPTAASYYVYRNTTNSSAGALNIGGTTGALTYSDTSGIAGSTYYYFVRAVNGEGFSGFSGGNSGFRLAVPPLAPSTIEASQGEFEGNIRVGWEATAETVDYAIYRNSVNSISGAVRVQSQPGLIFYDNSAEPGRTYYYYVVSRNNAGSSSFSAAAIGYVGSEDPTDDPYENNDTFLNAHSLKSMEDEWLSSDEGKAIANDMDWFEVKTSSNGNRLDLVVSFEGQAGPMAVKLYDSAGNEVATATDGVSSKVVSYEGASPSKSYYIAVEASAESETPYDITWSSLEAGESGIRLDGTVGTSSSSKRGEGIINPSAAGQTVSSLKKSYSTRRALFDVKNDSAIGEDVNTTSRGGTRFFKTSYYSLENGIRENVTAEMVSVGRTVTLDAQGKAYYEASVTPTKALKKHRTGKHYLAMKSTSVTSPAISDTNRFHVIKLKKPIKNRSRR
ncbi:MAG: pre-peptidase C-terminal domain-containing protein [Verrucomicrobiales bacterium]|nr:pre-peptidase C-terminal domain-containing protein [Verrucomicrobiales bacterium]